MVERKLNCIDNLGINRKSEMIGKQRGTKGISDKNFWRNMGPQTKGMGIYDLRMDYSLNRLLRLISVLAEYFIIGLCKPTL